MSTCRSCNAPIRWARTAHGKAIPIDPEPMIVGNLEFTTGEMVRYVQPDANAVENRYRAHFVTCPNANGHRKARSR